MSKSIRVRGDGWGIFATEGERMSAADQYRRNASECIAITAFFSDSRQRATILALAEAWTRLAQQAEKYEDAALVTLTDAPPHSGEGA
jgi:hypothetical protein